MKKKVPCLISPVPLPLLEEVALCGLCPSLGHDGQEEEKSWEEQLDAHQEQLEKEMQEARRMVFRLQVMHFKTNCCSGLRDISDRVAALFATNPQSKEQVVKK